MKFFCCFFYKKSSLLFASLALANLAAWLWAWSAFAGHPALFGTALLAWVFGLRHAVDADHIAAIDNVVRTQAQRGADGHTVGLWFSLGHSTIVMLACVGIAATAALSGRLEAFHAIGGVVGTAISAAFLLLIAAANTAILADVWRRFRLVRAGGADSGAVAAAGGGLARLFRPLFRLIRRNWHMYPLGFLFGLGFDTATEIGLLGIAATQAAQGAATGLSGWSALGSALVFPALFTAGMALVDTADSALMTGAYGWAMLNPLRKLWYNLTITAASVAVAVLIGGLETLSLLAGQFHPHGAFWRAVAALSDDMANFGFVVIGIFVLAWVLSALIYRWKRLGEVRG
jgi:high-affinity nickel-transport protein